jgi:hypothetical protein
VKSFSAPFEPFLSFWPDETIFPSKTPPQYSITISNCQEITILLPTSTANVTKHSKQLIAW